MAELTPKARAKLPAKKFGEPSKRGYPVNDKAHAANAKARAKQQLDRGNLDTTTYNHIVKMADSIQGHDCAKGDCKP